MVKTFSQRFSKYKSHTSEIKILVDSLNEILKNQGLRSIDNGGNPIAELIDKGSQNDDTWIKFRELARKSELLAKLLDESYDGALAEHLQFLEWEREKNRENRVNLWKLWLEKYLRWIIGIFIAILLYSIFTSLTEGSKFWKIPVKETIEKFAYVE